MGKAALALAATGVLAIGGWTWATAWAPSATLYPLQGVDLPERPGPIEWGTVRARGADFAYLVATSGTDRRDPEFEVNWDALPAAGLRRGAVHLYSLCEPGRAQANAFNTFVPRSVDGLPMAVDLSFRPDCAARPPRDAVVADLRAFAAAVEAHLGKPVILRVGKDVEAEYRLTAAIDRPVWAVANWRAPDYTARPWRLWRASDKRRVDGIEGPVNWNVVAP